jgi:hypothetical protein
MADLLEPLQAVLTVLSCDRGLELLQKYAQGLDERDREQETQSLGVRLLAACREIFAKEKTESLGADDLIEQLVAREEEPWATYRYGRESIKPEGLAHLLRPYGIHSEFNKPRTARVYYAARFADAWQRYLRVPSRNPSSPYSPSDPSARAAVSNGQQQRQQRDRRAQ